MLRAKRDRDAKRESEVDEKGKRKEKTDAQKAQKKTRPDKNQNITKSRRIIGKKGQRRDGRQQTARTRRPAEE